MHRPRVLALVGPTAAGKTELALELAAALGAEIVSVDSRQVYRRLDIGTAKPDLAARRAVRHHLIDVVEPDEKLDAAGFAALARAAIADILGRGRAVLLCGGSGLYLRALVGGLCSAPPGDAALRAALRAELAERGAASLHGELLRLDPAAAERIAPRDAPRILRALEVVRLTGRPLSDWQRAHGFSDRPFDVLTWVLSPPVDELDRRIAARARAMWRSGLVEETAAALAAGFSPDLPALGSIGYREAQRHLRGELEADAAVEAIALATRRYAKRQRTWFRGVAEARWVDGAHRASALLGAAHDFLHEPSDAAHLS